MPNLVLKSNTADRTFIVQHKILPMPVQPGIVELVITPLPNYTIDAKDFTAGLLPRQISNIKFVNLGKKVIAKVYIRSVIDLNETLNLSLPISGQSFVKKETFNVSTTTNADERIIVVNSSTHPRSVDGNNITYNISNDLGKKILLFSKKFTVTGDDNFLTPPSYSIKNKNTNYTVVSRIKKGMKNKIISKTFDVFYTSSKVVSRNLHSEISFNAKISTPKIKVSKKIATKKEEYKIYSVNQGRKIGSEGGIKKIRVKGVPGTPFKVLVSNASNNTYNTKTGVFEAGGGMIEGIIPSKAFGRHFGEAKINVNIPRTTTTETITVKFIDDAPIDHTLIKSPADADKITNITSGGVQAIASNAIATLSVKATATNGGVAWIGLPVVVEGGGDPVTTLFLGKGNAEHLTFKEPQTSKFAFTVKTTGATGQDFIKIVRQPLFEMPTGGTDNFLDWDSDETKKALAQQADGTPIPSDWNFSSDAALASGLKVTIKARVKGVGTIKYAGYSEVIISGSISVHNTGNIDSDVSLKLLNFLTRVGV